MSQNPDFVLEVRTDLLGAIGNHIIFARFISDFLGKKLYISNKSDMYNMHGFEHQDLPDLDKGTIVKDHGGEEQYALVGNESKDEHINNRIVICSALLQNAEEDQSNLIKIGDTFELQNIIFRIGLNRVINDQTIPKIREDLLSKLPETTIDTSKLIAIHYRAGEIVKMKERFIHSSKYSSILKELREQYPHHKIIVFTGKLPPSDYDDLSTFDGCEIYSNKPNSLEIWRIFVESDVFVMGRSSYSYTPSLLRHSHQKTYYPKIGFWHPKLDHWDLW